MFQVSLASCSPEQEHIGQWCFLAFLFLFLSLSLTHTHAYTHPHTAFSLLHFHTARRGATWFCWMDVAHCHTCITHTSSLDMTVWLSVEDDSHDDVIRHLCRAYAFTWLNVRRWKRDTYIYWQYRHIQAVFNGTFTLQDLRLPTVPISCTIYWKCHKRQV